MHAAGAWGEVEVSPTVEAGEVAEHGCPLSSAEWAQQSYVGPGQDGGPCELSWKRSRWVTGDAVTGRTEAEEQGWEASQLCLDKPSVANTLLESTPRRAETRVMFPMYPKPYVPRCILSWSIGDAQERIDLNAGNSRENGDPIAIICTGLELRSREDGH